MCAHLSQWSRIRCGLILFWYVKQNASILYWYKKSWKTGSDAVAFLSSFHLLLPVEIECLRKTMYKIKNISYLVIIKFCFFGNNQTLLAGIFQVFRKVWITFYRTETGNVIIFKIGFTINYNAIFSYIGGTNSITKEVCTC